MLRISKISFPGLGIGEFNINSVAFTIFGVEIAWYAVIITFGMILAVAYTIYRAKKIGIKPDSIMDFALFAIPSGIVGARLYYVIMKPSAFGSLWDVINIRDGGLGIYGGIILGTTAFVLVAKYKKIPLGAIADCAAPALILAQGIGRWGNFMNGEAYGYETDIFIRMGISNSLTGYVTEYVHPTFLYESVWNILGFVLANIIFKKKKYDGQIVLVVFGWYALGRMFIEGLRSDSLWLFGTSLRVSQVLAALIFVACTALLITFIFKRPKKDMYIHQDIKKTEK